MRIPRPLLLIIVFVLFPSFGQSPERVNEVNSVIKQFIGKFAPDRRTAIFNVEAVVQNNKLVLIGKTNLLGAKAFLFEKLTSLKIDFQDQIKTLPEDELGERTYGIITNSVGNMRGGPKHSAEMVTQTLLGTCVNVLEKQGTWYNIQTPDRYLGWIDHGAVRRVTKNELEHWKNAPKVIFTGVVGFSYTEPDTESQTVSDLVFGDILELKDTKDDFYQIAYPDGRKAYLEKRVAKPYAEWLKNTKPDTNNLLKASKKLMGVPYLWGGTSTKGMDCSGFTKTTYLMNGLLLPRDASQQALVGEGVETEDNFSKLKTGDLLFFGNSERVVHVGMWIGNGQFIHASNRIEISSFVPTAHNFDEYNFKRFLFAKRILGTNAEKKLE
jgi:gamma-D-glutamyl-L-lysine dipeptidyl-peptidase